MSLLVVPGTRNLLVDVDAGIDDAMALLMALAAHRRGDINLVAITTVHGSASVDDVVVNVFRTLDAAGMPNIPVYRGCSEPIVIDRHRHQSSKHHGTDGFNDVQFDSDPDVESRLRKEHAVTVITSVVNQHPGEITLVALGPLTNVGLAFKLDPELAFKLAGMFIMGGNHEGVGDDTIAAEFNFHSDPEAAHVVLDKAGLCDTTIATWELCLKYTKIEMNWRVNVLGNVETPAAALMNKLEQVWFDSYKFDPDLHIQRDQLAMVAALDKTAIKQATKHWATVELAGTHTRGQMVLEPRWVWSKTRIRPANVTVINKLDEEVLKKHLLRAFGHN